MDLVKAKKEIEKAIIDKELLSVVGECYVEYQGRAASKLGRGSRMILVKGDGSFAVHQNKYLRPVNYMMNSSVYCKLNIDCLELMALKAKPKESLKALFYSVDFVKSFSLTDQQDLRLFGSELELQKLLAQDLEFIEKGLKPLKREQSLRKGVMDIIAEDNQGRVVCVEVKRRKAGLDCVSQLHRYKEQLKKLKNKESRGILLAPDITSHALELLHNYGLEYFKLDFQIGNPSAKIKGLEKKQTKLF
ncbi:MAG: endonuclease NucS [archaeon]